MKKLLSVVFATSLVFSGVLTVNAEKLQPSTTGMHYEQFSDYESYLKGYTNKNRIMIFELDKRSILEGYTQIKEVRGFTNGETVFYKRHLIKSDDPLVTKMKKNKKYLVVYAEFDLTEQGILDIIELHN